MTSFVTRPWQARSWTERLCLLSLIAVITAIVHVLTAHAHTVGVLLAVNQLVTPQWTMKKIGQRLMNNWVFGSQVTRSYDDQYKVAGAKVGYTVNARLPQKYQVNKGQALIPQPIIDNVVPITLTDQANIGLEFSTASLAMEVDDYNEKCISPAIDALVNAVDADGLQRMYRAVSQTAGTPGTIPGSTGTLPQAANITYLNAKTKLDNAGVSPKNRVGFFSSDMHAYLASGNVALFNPAAQISSGFRTGEFARESLGMKRLFMDQNVFTHTIGALGGTPTVNGASQVGNSIVTNGWSNSVTGLLKQGDVIQFAGVNAVNPLSFVSTGKLRDFTVTADVNSDGSGNATIPIDPPIITAGAYATCTASPANGALIQVFSTAAAGQGTLASTQTPQGMIFDPAAFALVFADLELPQGMWVNERISNKALGVAVRFLKGYDIMTDLSPARVDLMYGWASVRPEMAVRVCS